MSEGTTANDFKPGDVVQLKSGGPKMTIESFGQKDGRPSARCLWFIEAQSASEIFALVALKRWQPASSSVGSADV